MEFELVLCFIWKNFAPEKSEQQWRTWSRRRRRSEMRSPLVHQPRKRPKTLDRSGRKKMRRKRLSYFLNVKNILHELAKCQFCYTHVLLCFPEVNGSRVAKKNRKKDTKKTVLTLIQRKIPFSFFKFLDHKRKKTKSIVD